MTVKELIHALQQFPEDKEVVIWTEKGYWYYDEADYTAGLFEVNTIKELTRPLDRKHTGNIKLDYLDDSEIESELRYIQYEKDYPDKCNNKKEKIYIKSKNGKGNYKDYETLSE